LGEKDINGGDVLPHTQWIICNPKNKTIAHQNISNRTIAHTAMHTWGKKEIMEGMSYYRLSG